MTPHWTSFIQRPGRLFAKSKYFRYTNKRLNTKQPKFRYRLGSFHADSIVCALAVGNSVTAVPEGSIVLMWTQIANSHINIIPPPRFEIFQSYLYQDYFGTWILCRFVITCHLATKQVFMTSKKDKTVLFRMCKSTLMCLYFLFFFYFVSYF